MATNRDKLIAKIRALMAKTVENGCTEAEAMNALNMAQTMMDAYDVTAEDLQEAKDESAIHDTMKDMRDPHNIRSMLVVKISEFTNTQTYRSQYKPQKYRYSFIGLRSDVDFAVWLTEHLTIFVQKELKKYLWDNGYQSLDASSKRHIISGFVIGCTGRINDRLGELIDRGDRNRTDNGNALMVIKDALIKAKMDEMGLRLRAGRSRRRYYSGSSYGAGWAAGDRANFGRPVGSTLRIGGR